MLAESGEKQGNEEGSRCGRGELSLQREGPGVPGQEVSTLSCG